MTNATQALAAVLKQAAPRYSHAAAIPDLKWAQEKLFAATVIRGNKDIRASLAHPLTQASILDALLQAAAMGLTLNPTVGHCYLIPRRLRKKKPEEVWDAYKREVPVIAYASPSYKGLLHLQVETGAIRFAAAEVVFRADEFRPGGPFDKPRHFPTLEAADRTEPQAIGVYALAKLPDGEWRYEYMDRATVQKIRAMSEVPDSTMWHPGKLWTEGWKKAVLRRLLKTQPGLAGHTRLQTALEVLNTHEGIETREVTVPERPARDITPDPPRLERISTDQHTELADLLAELRMRPQRLCAAFGVEALEQLPAAKYPEAKARLAQAAAAKQGGGA